MRARTLLVITALSTVLASCASKAPPPASPVAPAAANPAPQPAAAPAAAPAPASGSGQFCWISAATEDSPRKSGCTVALDQCQKDADEMRARPDTKLAQECTKQSPVHCYVFADEPTPLCYASIQDCNDGRGRMSGFGKTTECETKP